MIESLLNVSEKVLFLFLLIGVGVVLARKKVVTETGASQMSAVLVNIVAPCVIIGAFQIDRDSLSLWELGVVGALSLLAGGVGIAVTYLFFRREPPPLKQVLRFGAIYPNSGFMGLPLIQAFLGGKGVIYASVFISVYNALTWTHGFLLMSGKGEKISPVKAVFNPGTLGIFIGLPLFLFSIRLPDVLALAVDSMASLNTPVAMLCVGYYIASVSLKETVKDLRIYKVSLIRLVLTPAALFLLMLPLGLSYDIFATLIIEASTPCAAMTAIFAARFQRDAPYASKLVAVSTLLSVVTMPLFASLVSVVIA